MIRSDKERPEAEQDLAAGITEAGGGMVESEATGVAGGDTAAPSAGPGAARLARAAAAAAAGAHQEALEHYHAALAADPANVDAMLGIGNEHLALSQYDAAEKEYRKALRLSANHPEVNYQLGLTLHRRGVYAGAAQQLRRVIEIDPEHVMAHIVMGEALNQAGDIDGAIDALETAVALNPQSGRAYYALGIAYDRKSQHERAAEMYRRSREVGGR